jgi:hypothetical protein
VGRVLLVFRLAARNLRRRPVEAALLVLAIMAATTMLTLGLALHGVTDNPYQRTREATAGADVVASVGPLEVAPGRAVPVDPARLEALTDVSGVVDHSGPYPATTAELEADGVRTDEVWAVGRDSAEVSVDQPELTQGSWVEDGGVVIEAAFADALDVGAGDQVTLNGRSFQVVGVAVTAAASYTDVCFGSPFCGFLIGPEPDEDVVSGPPPAPPDGQTATVEFGPSPDDAGLVWLTQTDARDLAPADGALSYVLNLKLADPADAPEFVDTHSPTSRDALFLASWLDIRDTYDEFVRGAQEALVTFSSLFTCSPWPASRSSSVAGWPTRPDVSDCSRQSAARPASSRSCCSPSTWFWPCSPPRLGSPRDGWPLRCSATRGPASSVAPVHRR